MTKLKLKYTTGPSIFGAVLFIFLLGTIIPGIEKRSINFVASQFLVVFLMAIHWNEYFKCKYPSLSDATVFCFTILFFCVAPNLQLYYIGQKLINTSYFRDEFGFYANVLCSIFILTYILTRKSNRIKAAKKISNDSQYKIETLKRFNFTFLIFFIFSIFAAFLAYKDIKIKTMAIGVGESDSIQMLLLNKVLYFFPYGFLALTIVFRDKLPKILGLFWLLLVAAAICLLICKNPVLVKRNDLGPIYISILYLWNQKIRYSKKLTLFTILSIMVILFPLSSLFTNVKFDNWSFDVNDLYTVISSHFLELHYDAWANFHTVIEIVNRQDGLSNGKQLLGSFLFFIPRSWWPDKPLATGNFIGDYLHDNYSMWFNNLSSPFISEAYIDFGFIGVLLYAYFLARFTIFLDKLSFSIKSWERIAGIYFAIYLFFVLRGSLMVAMAYGVGSTFVFMLIRLLNQRNFKTNNALLRQQRNSFNYNSCN